MRKRLLTFLMAMVMLIVAVPLNIIANDSVGELNIYHNGRKIRELDLIENEKLELVAEASDVNNVTNWQWEILADEAKDLWIAIGDKTEKTCLITYALLYGCLDENGEAKVRVSAIDGETKLTSAPVKVRILYNVSPEDLGMTAEYVAPTVADNAIRYSLLGARSYNVAPLAEDLEGVVSVTIRFVRSTDRNIDVAREDSRTFISNSAVNFTFDFPSVTGYKVDSIVDANGNETKITDGTTSWNVSFSADQMTENKEILVVYAPQEVTYTVYHYLQEIYSDFYDETTPYRVEEWTGYVDDIIEDVHLTPEETHRPNGEMVKLEGFQVTYYEKVKIAADGSTVVKVYYDRLYYYVLFNMEAEAYGQDHVYVRYGTPITANRPIRAGYGFNYWNILKYGDENADDTLRSRYNISNAEVGTKTVEVTANMIYSAEWTKDITHYTVIYWKENANDGNYSVWMTEEVNNVYSGTLANWNGVIPQAIKDSKTAKGESEYEFFTLDTAKTYDPSNVDVLIEGDGSTIVNVYFARRTYSINFEAYVPSAGNCQLPTHSHDDGTCQFNPMYCTHRHSDACRGECKSSEHEHTTVCGINCNILEHKHISDCCDVHTHNVDCYSSEKDLESGISEAIQAAVDAKSSCAKWFADIIGTTKNEITQTVNNIRNDLKNNPPKNLRDGYIYKIVGNEQFEINLYIYKETYYLYYEMNIIYINGDWYYYDSEISETDSNGNIKGNPLVDGNVKPTGTIIEPDNCSLPFHDHTSGCQYGTKCTKSEHVHLDSCYNCQSKEHTHSNTCTCTHEHDASCFGNQCLKAEHDHSTHDGKVTVIRTLQAKYGQEITALLPYYIELNEDGLHQDSNGHNFTGWTYSRKDVTQTEFVAVKHVTMVSDLCYSEGVTATAKYDESAKNAHVLFYMYESFDNTSPERPLSVNGDARQKWGDKYYDSNIVHIQIVMSSTKEPIEGGNKEIEGMTIREGTYNGNDMSPLMQEVEFDSTTLIFNVYFYDRNPVNSLELKNNGSPYYNVTEGLSYGMSLTDIQESFLGGIAIDPPEYPSTLEPNAYEFDGWYTLDHAAPEAKVEWDTLTLGTEDMILYAVWKPVQHTLRVFSTVEKTEQIGETELVEHGSVISGPKDPERQSYTFNGWFYWDDESDSEKAFYFNLFPVKKDMDIYAKWTSNVIVQYRVSYGFYDENGDFVEIAEPMVRSGLAGQNRTVQAKVADQLNEGYRTHYYPETSSHTIYLQDLGEGVYNEYRFIYSIPAKVDYWVKYVDISTGNPVIDENGNAIPTKHVEDTQLTAVTEVFMPIDGYTADKYSKYLLLSATNQEENNVITFYYTQNETPVQNAPYRVTHMIQNADRQTYTVYGDPKDIVGVVNEIYGITDDQIYTNLAGYTYNESKTTVTTSEGTRLGTSGVLGESGMEFTLYYDRNYVDYTVRYLRLGTTEKLAEDLTVYGSAANGNIFGKEVTATALDLRQYGYQLASEESKTIALSASSSNNVITFYYEPLTALYSYELAGDYGSTRLRRTSERPEYAQTTPLEGSYPYIDPNYRFLGWYAKDGETYVLLTEENAANYHVRIEGDTLVPQAKPYTVNGELKYLYTGDTFYAFFEPNESTLTIEINAPESDGDDANQQFVFRIKGKEDDSNTKDIDLTVVLTVNSSMLIDQLPVGYYEISEIESDWTWRYNEATAENSSNFYVGVNDAVIEFTAQVKTDQWFNGESFGDYPYQPYNNSSN